MKKTIYALALSALAVLAVGLSLRAADPVPTTVTVEGMHCEGCAKKIAGRLKQVPGVAEVRADVESGRLTIAPRPQQAASVRAIWEAVEKAGYRPTKLEGPSGTFTAKPKS